MSSDWVKSFSDIAGYAKNAAQQASTMMAGSELERKLAEATSNEPWGASSTMLQEISRATFAYDDFKTVMLFVWRSAQNQGALWRVTYKTLNMLDYILRHGSERVIEDAKDHLREIKKLQKFEYVDPDGKDQGVNVREKARQLVEMLTSEEALNAERDKARATRNKYGGVSAAEMSGGGGGGGGGGEPLLVRRASWDAQDYSRRRSDSMHPSAPQPDARRERVPAPVETRDDCERRRERWHDERSRERDHYDERGHGAAHPHSASVSSGHGPGEPVRRVSNPWRRGDERDSHPRERR